MTGTRKLRKQQAHTLTEAVVWGRLTLRADHFYRDGSTEPVCDMTTMAPLLMAGLFKSVTRSAVEITLEGRKVERAANGFKNDPASNNLA
jgi:hypothetical protein